MVNVLIEIDGRFVDSISFVSRTLRSACATYLRVEAAYLTLDTNLSVIESL
jgi:hypothetical protein